MLILPASHVIPLGNDGGAQTVELVAEETADLNVTFANPESTEGKPRCILTSFEKFFF